MMVSKCWEPTDWVWALSTDFGITVFTMTFITWTLVIINLMFAALFFVHYFFGKQGVFR